MYLKYMQYIRILQIFGICYQDMILRRLEFSFIKDCTILITLHIASGRLMFEIYVLHYSRPITRFWDIMKM